MPRLPVPGSFDEILDSVALVHLATIGPDGRPQVNPIWFVREGEHILFSVKDGAQKLLNIQRDPHIALSFSDLENPGRYLELRGAVVSIDLYEDLDFVNILARKYTGADFSAGKVGERRFKLTFAADRWTGQ
jgi:PPOX class probable F420-dependent enzyme